MRTTSATIVTFATGACLGVAIGLPIGAIITQADAPPAASAPASAPVAQGQPFDVMAYAHSLTGPATPQWQPTTWVDMMLAPPAAGPDPAEDDEAFDCRVHGNHICGPGNPDGYAPGLYGSDGLILLHPWPVAEHQGTGAEPGPVTIDTADLNGQQPG